MPSSTSGSNPLPTTSLCRALALASQLAKVYFDTKDIILTKSGRIGLLWSISTPFPMSLLTIYVFELFPQFKLFVSQRAGNEVPLGERARGDGGNH